MNKIFHNSIKKHAGNFMSTCLILSMVAGWWGVLYPQLTLNADTYRVVTESGDEIFLQEECKEKSAAAIYMEMLNADKSRFRIRFGIIEEIMLLLGKKEQ